MNTMQQGNAVVVVIIIMTVLMLCTINGLKKRFLLQELVYKQQEYEQHFWAAEGLLQYGIAVAQSARMHNPNAQPFCQECKQWPLPSGDYQGTLCLTPAQDRIAVHAQIKNRHGTLLCAHSCCVAREGDRRVIREWNIEG